MIKAFDHVDTMDHNILHSKPEYYGDRELSLDWFISYLRNRKQYVTYMYMGSHYDNRKVGCGVPQCSVLVP